MSSATEAFFRSLKGKKICFIGAGVSHVDAIKMFAGKGLCVELRDKRSKEELGEIAEEFEKLGVSLVLGENYLEDLDAEVIFRTPGMNFLNPALINARKRGAVVTSELETFFDLCPCKSFAVTGSDGKTTSTTLIAELLKAQGYNVLLGGNIGKALLPEIEKVSADDVVVAELSSFQLMSMRNKFDVSVVTNVAPNHLDVHKDMAEYIGAKKNIYAHQNAFSRTVLNADNEITCEMGNEIRGEAVYFSLSGNVKDGAYFDGEYLCYAKNGKSEKIIKASDIRIRGMHNVDNFLTAIAATYGYVKAETVEKVAKEFGGVEHRIEFVREKNGVKWYNDSIATNPTRTIAGLRAFDRKMIIIAGGYDKKIPFEPLAPEINARVKLLILTGATADKIETAVKSDAGYDERTLKIIRAADLEEAVKIADENAGAGDIVSLSPACASFDKYRNFEERGRHFKRLVSEL